MIPVLYLSTEQTFTTQGVGVLSDAISCVVEEERNGAFELTMEYPITGACFEDIQLRSIILAKPNPTDQPQPFRVYSITGNMSGTATINAEHISYDMSGIPVQPFYAASMAAAMTAIVNNAVVDCPFTLTTDKTVASPMEQTTPASMRSLLGGTAGSLLDRYGGEWKWDRFTASLLLHRGQDNGVVIKYGKNLTDLEQEKNCAECWTGVYPYWVSQDGLTVVQLPERVIYAVTNDDYTLDTQSGTTIQTEDDIDLWLEDAPVDGQRILMLNLSQSEEDAEEQGEEAAPTVAELRERAQAYIDKHDIFAPKVSLKVSFEQLESTEEYKDIALLEQVNLCDTVKVVFPDLGVSTKAKVVKTTYNGLLDRYESIEIGTARTNIADTIATMQSDITTATDDAYAALAAGGGYLSGDLYVGGTLALAGTFENMSSRVKIRNPRVWLSALGEVGAVITQTLSNGLTLVRVGRNTGVHVLVYGTGTDTTAATFTLDIAPGFASCAPLVSADGTIAGGFSVDEYGTVTATLTTTDVYVFGEIILPGEM